MGKPAFDTIKEHCEEDSSMSARILDDFLIYYAAEKNKLEPVIARQFGRYKTVIQTLPQEWPGLVTSQLIGHQIFKKNGLIHKYLQHRVIKDMPDEEYAFLEKQAATPWRFSFATVLERPDKDFFIMRELFSQEQYLLYSPGMSRELAEDPLFLHLNLISYNGLCWQAYGPINSYMSFDYDDIFFFASEVDQKVEGDEDVMQLLNRNPLPFLLLFSGSRLPVTFHGKIELVQNVSEDEGVTLDPQKLEKDFDTDKVDSIWRFSLKGWDSVPHFARLYFDEETKTVVRTAMSDVGFNQLTKKLKRKGYAFDEYADIRLHLSMSATIERILNKKVDLIPCEKKFEEETSPIEEEHMGRLNKAMQQITEDLNEGNVPDYAAISRETGADEGDLRTLAKEFQNMIDRIPKKK